MKNNKAKPIPQRVNQIIIGDIEVLSNEMSLQDCSDVAFTLLNQPEVKDYLNTLKLTKQLKDGQTYYG